MNTIEIKKSNLALLNATGKTNEEIATIYGITVAEVRDLKVTFGITKSRSTKNTKTYTIVPIDDTKEILEGITSKQESLALQA